VKFKLTNIAEYLRTCESVVMRICLCRGAAVVGCLGGIVVCSLKLVTFSLTCQMNREKVYVSTE
jgi:low affinity Fe/Cu permease